AARRAIRAGRHAADGRGADGGSLHRRQLQGDAADRRASRPAGDAVGGHLPGRHLQRARRQHRSRQRPGVRPAAARQRHRQLHQDRAAHPGEDRARCGQPARRRASPRHVGLPDHRHHAAAGAQRVGAGAQRRVRGGAVMSSIAIASPPMRLPSPNVSSSASADKASLTAWIAVLASMIGAFMAILNIQITNASLLDIEGGIGTGVDNGAWISTSYLIGEIIVIPLTDYLSRVFSFRRYMLANAVLFALFSIACAFSHDLGSMIVMRGLQGFAGGVLIPMAFTMVLTKLPKAQQPIGLACFALAVTFAPAIGPTIGGYLTENYGWQTIFFVNTPPSIV